MKYAGLLTFCHDFVLVPRRCDMTQLLDVFMAVNVGDGADDLVDVLSYDEFINFLAVFAMRHTPPKYVFSAVVPCACDPRGVMMMMMVMMVMMVMMMMMMVMMVMMVMMMVMMLMLMVMVIGVCA